ncbi:MAG: hypothetical protein H8D65_00960 [Spirochaetes bacterium]|nr:hypothetical protein [Spirochaetota bacterium]
MKLQTSPIPVERLDTGIRWYYPSDIDISAWEYVNTEVAKPSSTSVLGIIAKPFLTRWRQENGHSTDVIMDVTGMRGDIFHMCADWLVSGLIIDEEMIRQAIESHEKFNQLQRIISYKYPSNPDAMFKSISRMLDGFAVFWDERQPEPMASEVMLYHEDFPWAGTADLVALFKARRNSKQPIRALIDYKTGAQNPEHILQNISYAILWNAHYPAEPVTHVANLYLTDGWRIKPTYKLTITKIEKEQIDTWHSVMDCWVALNSVRGIVKGPKLPPVPTTLWNLKKEL